MLSLSQFRHNLFPLFNVLRNTGETFEVAYRGKVYLVSARLIEGKKPVVHRAKKVRDSNVAVITAHCPICSSLVLNNICMKKDCPFNHEQPSS